MYQGYNDEPISGQPDWEPSWGELYRFLLKKVTSNIKNKYILEHAYIEDRVQTVVYTVLTYFKKGTEVVVRALERGCFNPGGGQ